ncbi:MAG: sulfatase-like hydrolase/transferase, partial [Acidobacteria bacterium]|nr:sulfatase-like hydrolase/transferase [Acidobacteriota bacterium]
FLFLHFFDAHDCRGSKAMDRRLTSAGQRLSRQGLARVNAALGRPLDPLKHAFRAVADRNVYGIRYHLRQVREIDACIGRVLEYLDRSGIYQRTCIVVAADHGDAFGEHGEFSHREYLYDTTIRIPLIIKGMSVDAPAADPRLTRSTDILPTLCHLMRIQSPPGDGINLLSRHESEPRREKCAYSETRCGLDSGDPHPCRSDLTSIRTAEWKMIIDQVDGARELYNLSRDPGEQHNLVVAEPAIALELARDLQVLTGEANCAEQTGMTDEEWKIVEDRLRSLGYL